MSDHHKKMLSNLEKSVKALQTAKLVEHTEAASKFGEKAGVYAIWGTPELKKDLVTNKNKMSIHCGKKVGDNQEVSLELDKFAQTSFHHKDGSFCFYVGKTADFAARHKIRRYEKFREATNLKLNELRQQLKVSFVKCEGWQERFFLENLAIGQLLPVLNIQPER